MHSFRRLFVLLLAGVLSLGLLTAMPASAESTDAERLAAAEELDLIDAEMRIRCPHTMPDATRAACLRDRYREDQMGHSNLAWGQMPPRYRNLLTAAVGRYRDNNREALTAEQRVLTDGEWARRFTNDTDCMVIHTKMGCVRQAQVDHQDDWGFIAKMSLTCSATTMFALATATGNPFVVGGGTAGLCLFTTLVWAF